MLLDIFIIIYALWLLVYTVKCEKRISNGLGYLIIGVVFTPIVGYALMYCGYFERHRKKPIKRERNHHSNSRAEVDAIN